MGGGVLINQLGGWMEVVGGGVMWMYKCVARPHTVWFGPRTHTHPTTPHDWQGANLTNRLLHRQRTHDDAGRGRAVVEAVGGEGALAHVLVQVLLRHRPVWGMYGVGGCWWFCIRLCGVWGIGWGGQASKRYGVGAWLARVGCHQKQRTHRQREETDATSHQSVRPLMAASPSPPVPPSVSCTTSCASLRQICLGCWRVWLRIRRRH